MQKSEQQAVDDDETAAAARLDEIWTRANALASTGNAIDALPLYQQVAAACPQIPEVQVNLGIVLYSLGRFDAAFERFEHVIAAHPDHLPAYLHAGSTCDSQGDLTRAMMFWQQAQDIAPDDVRVQRLLAGGHMQANRLVEAEAHYTRVLATQPDDVESLYALGIIKHERRDFDAAIELFQRGAARNPHPRFTIALANSLGELNRNEEALELARTVTEDAPNEALAWHCYAGRLLAANEPREALECLRRAAALAPSMVEITQSLARCYATLGQLGRARDILATLLDRHPRSTAVRHDLALVHFQLGSFAPAEMLLRQLLEESPKFARGWLDLANLLSQDKQYDEAIDAAMQAVELGIDNNLPLVVIASCLWSLGDRQGAIDLATDKLKSSTDHKKSTLGFAQLLESWKQTNAATEAYRQLLRIDPDEPTANARLLDLTLSSCDWSDYDGVVSRQIDLIDRTIKSDDQALDIDVFNLQALPVSYAFTARTAKKAATTIKFKARLGVEDGKFHYARHSRRKIRLGYALAYTWFHSLPLVLKPIVERHDRDRFEVFGYSVTQCRGSTFSKEYRAAFDTFRDIPQAAPHEAAKIIHADEIDVLIDVTGLTAINCMPVSSFRPAPVQIHGYGYSVTTGADYIDYLITDRTYIPPEWEALGPEKLIYLPNTFMPTRTLPTELPAVSRADENLPEDAIIFCNFNHPCKFEPIAFSAWMRILQQTPGSVMWFGAWLADTQDNLRREAASHGVDPDRLVFSSIVEHETHLARLQLADLALDNLRHGGGVTTVDALWAGLPVLTVLGDTPAARLGATLATAADAPELIAPDLKSYERSAIELASDNEARQVLRQKLLANRCRSPLFDHGQYQRHLETALEAAWRQHVDGGRPQRIEVKSDGTVEIG